MRLLPLILAVFVVAPSWSASAAKPAEEFFHVGAGLFIEGETEPALVEVNAGLEVYPDDAQLLALKAALEQQQEQEQQQQQQQQDEQQDQQEDQQDEEPQEQENQEQEQPPDQNNQPSPEEQDGQESAPSEEMTEEEAEMLLEAMKEEEAAERENMRLLLGTPVPVAKDW